MSWWPNVNYLAHVDAVQGRQKPGLLQRGAHRASGWSRHVPGVAPVVVDLAGDVHEALDPAVVHGVLGKELQVQLVLEIAPPVVRDCTVQLVKLSLLTTTVVDSAVMLS